MDISKIEINREFEEALSHIDDLNTHLFITGRAGTGKSTLLFYLNIMKNSHTVILAPTGVAALNVGGQTIHSFFRFRPNITPDYARKKAKKIKKYKSSRIYKKINTIIIDEVSMVRADLLDSIDQFLRIIRNNEDESFGGVKMIFIGDLFQLPPVVTRQEERMFTELYKSPYFFDSFAYKELNLKNIEFEKIYRQTDESFINLLNNIRNNNITNEDLELLNSRYDPIVTLDNDFYVYLTTINNSAKYINNLKLNEIESTCHKAMGLIEGDFSDKLLPTDTELTLKPGAQIMLLNNDSKGRWINGSLAKINDIRDDTIEVDLMSGGIEEVKPYSWEIYKYKLTETNKVKTETVGTFTQFPIKLAWAITIHKSQGKTFDKAVIDFNRGTFATGQAYVALSRCRKLEDIILTRKIKRTDIIIDPRVVKFYEGLNYSI